MSPKLLFASLTTISVLGAALPAWAGPVLWNYTKETVTFRLCEFSSHYNRRVCDNVTYTSGGYGLLRCETDCSVSIQAVGKIPAQTVRYRDGMGVTLDRRGLRAFEY